MSSIFNYFDYRKYLVTYYEEKKKCSPHFSYQSFALKAGFSSKSFIYNVLHGTKTLSRTSVVKICRALGFSKSEASYFELLVYFNQAVSYSERSFYFDKLNALVTVHPAANNTRQLQQDQYEFYAKWYHVVVRALIDLYPGESAPKFFADRIVPRVSARDVQNSLKLLLRLGLIIQEKSGGYLLSDKLLTTGSDIQTLAVQQFHLTCMEQAAEALKMLPRNRRDISGLTLGISEDGYRCLLEEIKLFQSRVLAIAERDTGCGEVYQVNLQLYPMTRPSATRHAQKTTSPQNTGLPVNMEEI